MCQHHVVGNFKAKKKWQVSAHLGRRSTVISATTSSIFKMPLWQCFSSASSPVERLVKFKKNNNNKKNVN